MKSYLDELRSLVGPGRFDEIVRRTDGLADWTPDAPDADWPGTALLRGLSLIAIGETAAGLSLLDEVVAHEAALSSTDAYLVHHWRGKASDVLGDTAGAALAYGAASRVDPNDINTSLFRERAARALAGDLPAPVRRLLADHLRESLGRPAAEPGAPESVRELSGRVAALERLAEELLERLRDADVRAAWSAPFAVQTEHPVALASADHVQPRGTANDNTRSTRFVRACETHFGRSLRAMDLGCAGGGLVRDFLLRGHRAVGLEGSDFSLLGQRAEWRVLPRHLATCDILEPFSVTEETGEPARFDVITAWEVLEHLPRERLPTFFANVRRHLAPDGLFVASVAQFDDSDPVTGAVWHVTLEPPPWWEARAAEAGLRVVASPFAPADYARGSGNGPLDWDVTRQPELGFHLVATPAEG